MTIQCNPNPGDQPDKPKPAVEGMNYQSEDGLVEVITKVESANRYPRHNYPVVCLRLRPRPGTRIQALTDGSGGLEVLLRHTELAAHVEAVNRADPKCGYQVPVIPEKPAGRKERWDAINRARWAGRK